MTWLPSSPRGGEFSIETPCCRTADDGWCHAGSRRSPRSRRPGGPPRPSASNRTWVGNGFLPTANRRGFSQEQLLCPCYFASAIQQTSFDLRSSKLRICDIFDALACSQGTKRPRQGHSVRHACRMDVSESRRGENTKPAFLAPQRPPGALGRGTGVRRAGMCRRMGKAPEGGGPGLNPRCPVPSGAWGRTPFARGHTSSSSVPRSGATGRRRKRPG